MKVGFVLRVINTLLEFTLAVPDWYKLCTAVGTLGVVGVEGFEGVEGVEGVEGELGVVGVAGVAGVGALQTEGCPLHVNPGCI